MTFGPVGRVAASLAMLVPIWWFVFKAGLFGLAGLFIWTFTFLPMGLRDIWRRAPRPREPRSGYVAPLVDADPATPREPQPGDISVRTGQQRW